MSNPQHSRDIPVRRIFLMASSNERGLESVLRYVQACHVMGDDAREELKTLHGRAVLDIQATSDQNYAEVIERVKNKTERQFAGVTATDSLDVVPQAAGQAEPYIIYIS